MLEIITGQKRNVFGVGEIERVISELNPHGTLYIGYPIIATADEPIVIEALLTSEDYGVVVFDLQPHARAQTFAAIEERQNDIHAAIFQKLLSFKPLRSNRDLSIDVHVITLVPAGTPATSRERVLICSEDQLGQVLKELPGISADQLRYVNAAIQRITTIKPANKRTAVTRADSRGAIMRDIEKEIANLDQWQKKAAIESPDAPQRIRGLAGSGKTIVLALKAAYLHARNPDWDIVVTFHTRALKQQFTDLIRRFCFEHLNDEPNWARLRILHSWGSSSSSGVYAEIAQQNRAPVRDFVHARNAYGYEGAFEGVCRELLNHLRQSPKPPAPLFDAILIDEAQDLPQPFFELAFLSTREANTIVWAYDELQSLNNNTMMPPAHLFGVDKAGKPNVPDVINRDGEPRRDIILPVCYRNTPWALTTAHAVGFGVYRQDGIVQYFDDANLWRDVGYEEVNGQLELGHQVTLERRAGTYPEYFGRLLKSDDAVVCKVFESASLQAKWVADSIATNISEDELDFGDILVVLPNALTARQDAAELIQALNDLSIPAHLAGVTTSVDELFSEHSIAITGIYRAKGNEAPMVYILNSEYGYAGWDLVKRRNALFTAITRSRAWVRICGVGPEMEKLKQEVDRVRTEQFRLAFRVPTAEELKKLRRIQRDIPPRELAKIRRLDKEVTDLLALVESGAIDRDNLPSDLREKLALLSAGHVDPE